MTDTQFQLSVTPEQYGALTDAGKATLDTALTKAGASPEQLAYLKAPAGSNKAAPVNPASALDAMFKSGKPGNDNPAYRPPPTAAGHLSPEVKIAAFQKLRAAGVADVTLQKAAAEEGVAWADIVKETPIEPPKHMNQQEAQAKLDATTGPHASGTEPNDYHFQFEQRHLGGLDETAVREIHDMFADGFHQGAIPLTHARQRDCARCGRSGQRL